MIDWYRDAVADFVPSKKRELPEWAQNIFSDSMIAAGNVRTDEEATAIVDLAPANLRVWFDSVPEYSGNASSEFTAGAQNYYCLISNRTHIHLG